MELRKEVKEYLLSLKPSDITAEWITNNLADRLDGKDKFKVLPPKINIYDTFILEAKEYFNTTKISTTVGRFIYNKVIIERNGLQLIVGYVNEPITSGVLGKIEQKIANALIDDIITPEQMVSYLNTNQWFSLQFNPIFSTSFSEKSIVPNKKVIKMRDELIKENKDKLEAGDAITAAKIEQELLKVAEEELKDDYGMDLFRSGGAGSFHNNYKAASIMKGPVYDPSKEKWDIVTSNLVEGLKKEDIPPMANSITTGAYPKAIGTATSGYLSKQLIAAFQTVTLDKIGSDCGTKNYLPIEVTKFNKKFITNRYIIENNKLVLMDDSNIDKYIGKVVKMRSPMYCIGDKLCRVCAGNMFDKLGIDNIGMSATKISGTLLNLNMKSFHDATVHITEIKKSEVEL